MTATTDTAAFRRDEPDATGAAGATDATTGHAAPTGIDLTGAAVGDVVASRTISFTRDSLVRYAGASGDFNPIHYRDDIAAQVGLPGVLAHGMLTMGAAVQPVAEALGDPARIVGYQTRFTKPVIVDATGGALVTIEATVGQTADEDGIGRIDLTVSFAGKTVLGKAQVRARFAPTPLPAGAATAPDAAPHDGSCAA